MVDKPVRSKPSIVYLYESREWGDRENERYDSAAAGTVLHARCDADQNTGRWSLHRAEILRILSEEEYGITPPPSVSVTGCVTERNAKCCCGHAVLETIDISFDTPKGIFRFPVRFSARQRRANTRCFFC